MRIHKPDKGLIIIIILLLVFGLAILFSASIAISQEKTGKPYYFFTHQLIYGVLPGLILFLVAQKIKYKFWKKLSLLIFFAALALCVLVFVPNFGYGRGSAQRWLNIGPFSFQPAEFLKLALIIYLSAFLSKSETQKGKINTFLPFLLIMGLIGALMALQSDAGTLGLIIAVGVSIYFLSGAKIKSLVIMGICCIIAFALLIKFAPHRVERIMTFLNPSEDTQGASYQINQSLLAIGSGGMLGRGLGHSVQRYGHLPEPMGDSIFAILAEEIGFVGSMAYIVFIILLTIKGFRMSQKIVDDFGRLLACGIVIWFAFQAIINISAIIGLIPLTGIPLPFVSYGGSALIICLTASGILVNISKHI